MGWTASLDMGSEKMVMALASVEGSAFHLKGIKIMASQGIGHGVVREKEKVKMCIRSLMSELMKDREIDVMNVALSGAVLRVIERRIVVPIQKRVVEQSDLFRAEQRCLDTYDGGQEEVIDILPVGYAIDRGEMIVDPVGRSGRNLEVTYQVYVADYDYLAGIRSLFEGCGIQEVEFYPAARAYAEALDVERADRDFALVDLGAMGINIVLFRDGMLEYEAHLPVGVRTIDTDTMAAFALSFGQARKLKHEYGQALRSACKNRKLPIPDTRLTLESRDLATVIQSRSEELLEGVIFQLQQWGFDDIEDPVFLTGGGSRLQDMDELLRRMFGHPVESAVARRIQVPREEVLRTPEYLVALGLLLCARQEPKETPNGIGEKIVRKIGKIFGI